MDHETVQIHPPRQHLAGQMYLHMLANGAHGTDTRGKGTRIVSYVEMYTRMCTRGNMCTCASAFIWLIGLLLFIYIYLFMYALFIYLFLFVCLSVCLVHP